MVDTDIRVNGEQIGRFRGQPKSLPQEAIPDNLTDVWVQIAEHDEAKAHELIESATGTQNPFDVKYSKVEDAPWESCTTVLNAFSTGELLRKPWN